MTLASLANQFRPHTPPSPKLALLDGQAIFVETPRVPLLRLRRRRVDVDMNGTTTAAAHAASSSTAPVAHWHGLHGARSREIRVA